MLALSLGLGARGAWGQALEVAPVSLLLQPSQRTATLTVTNRGDQKTAIQTRAFLWEQQDGADRLTPAKNLAVSPPLFELGPNETQLIRIVLRTPATRQEASYRLFLDQIPGPAAPSSIRVALRISLPVFAETPVRAAPALTWRVERKGQETWLVAHNSGARHARISHLSLAEAAPAVSVMQQGNSYVLAGAEQRWKIKAPPDALKPGASLRVTAETEEGRLDATAAVLTSP